MTISRFSAETAPKTETIGVVVIHGVGATEPGWINEYLIPRLEAHAPGAVFEQHSEVYRLADRGRTRQDRTFPAHVRRARSAGGRPVAFMELFWADLSQIGTGTITNWLVMLKLFYEAPQVLGDCFLDKSRNGIANAIAFLVRMANWVLRWPITGLNTVALVCAFAILARQRLVDIGSVQPFLTVELPYVLTGLLATLAIGSVLFARWRVHRDIALTDIGMSTAACSVFMIVAILLARFLLPPESMANPAIYLMGAGTIIFGFWFIWNYAVFIAILLLIALGVTQLLLPKSEKFVPLARPASAIGLCIIQGVIWKILISLLWVFIFVTLDFNERTVASCAADPYEACTYLAGIRKDLVGIAIFNMLMVGVLTLAFFSIGVIRAVLRWPARRPKANLAKAFMPRMVVSPLVIVTMFAATVFNLVVFYWRTYIPVDLYQALDVRLLPFTEVVGYLIGGGTALSLAFYVFRALQHASRGILHIVRDIVDHQFAPRFTFSRRLLPRSIDNRGEHPRRARIEQRLDVLMQELVAKEKFDRLIFVAHSQGTVVLHDYLSTKRDEESIRGAKSIDVLTLGSPLTHLYQYYFAKYAATSMGPQSLNPLLTSWTNMWRVDDPIGNRIELLAGDFIKNEALRPGGHVDYWKEDAVCHAILDLIDPELKAQRAVQPEAAPVAATPQETKLTPAE